MKMVEATSQECRQTLEAEKDTHVYTHAYKERETERNREREREGERERERERERDRQTDRDTHEAYDLLGFQQGPECPDQVGGHGTALFWLKSLTSWAPAVWLGWLIDASRCGKSGIVVP
jgi:hypothetical protein